MNDTGWVKIHRKILENPSLMRGDYLAVWVYILLSVNHTETKEFLAGKTIAVKPGQGIFSTLKMSDVLCISVSKIRRILNFFENEHQIEQQKTTKGSVISVLNWDMYQQVEHQNEHQLNINCTSTEHQLNNLLIIKECKELNNKKEKITKKEKPPRHQYGEYKNVLLSDEDLEKLKKEFPDDWQEWIERVSGYCKQYNKSYSDYLATIRNWARKDKKEQTNGASSKLGGKPSEFESRVEEIKAVVRAAQEQQRANTVGTLPLWGDTPGEGVRAPVDKPWERKSQV